MKRFNPIELGLISISLAGFVGALGCAHEAQLPAERIAGSEAAVRTAEQTGTAGVNDPTAQLHLRLARDELAAAKRQLDEGNNHRADLLFIRARVDAELAQALAMATTADRETDQLMTEIQEVKASIPPPASIPAPAPDTTAPATAPDTTPPMENSDILEEGEE